MDIKNLPTGGYHWRLDKGKRNFAYKLYRVTKHGDLRNLADNRETIVESLKPYTRAFKKYGGLNRLQQRRVYKTIRKKEGELNWGDRRDVKKVIKYLGRNKSKQEEVANPFALEKEDESQSGSKSGAGAGSVAAQPRVRINKDVSNVPSRVNPYLHRVSRYGEVRHLGIVDANPSSTNSAMRREEGGFVVPPPPGAKPPQPLSREPASPESGRLRRVS